MSLIDWIAYPLAGFTLGYVLGTLRRRSLERIRSRRGKGRG